MTYEKHILKSGDVVYLTRNGSGDYRVTVNGHDGSAYTMHPSYSEAHKEYIQLIAADNDDGERDEDDRSAPDDSVYRRDMIDAGRGHLLR